MKAGAKTSQMGVVRHSRRQPYSTSAVAGDVELYTVALTPDPHLPFDIRMAGRSVWGPSDAVRNNVSTDESVELVLGGKGVLLCNDQRYELAHGDVFFLHRGSRHTYYAVPGSVWRKLFVIFWPENATPLLRFLHLHEVVRLHVPPAKFARIRTLFHAILQLAHTKPPFFRDHLSERAYELLLELARIKQSISSHPVLPIPVQLAVQYAEQRGCREITPQAMALAAGCSLRHLSRLFLACYNLTVREWLIQFKLQHACALLRHTNNHIGDIAEAVGYLDPLHFTRVFKQVIGCSPRAYRARPRPCPRLCPGTHS
ncbi:MAG: AraC family transcriptional regulator [bacterium]|nr:AraC family transcriptional regulator [bacterium]